MRYKMKLTLIFVQTCIYGSGLTHFTEHPFKLHFLRSKYFPTRPQGKKEFHCCAGSHIFPGTSWPGRSCKILQDPMFSQKLPCQAIPARFLRIQCFPVNFLTAQYLPVSSGSNVFPKYLQKMVFVYLVEMLFCCLKNDLLYPMTNCSSKCSWKRVFSQEGICI